MHGHDQRARNTGRNLRQLRKDSGKTREQVAEFVGCSPVTITRIESAQSAPRLADTARMLECYGITGERREILMTLCGEARKRGWWHQYSGTIPAWFEVYVGIEAEVSEIRSYQPEAIDGRLQTEGYIRAIMQADVDVPSEEELDRRVSVRMTRQEQFFTGDDAPRMWVVLNEAALRRQVGGPATMKNQLRHLIEVSRSHKVVMQVLTYAGGAHPAMDGAFEILRFPDTADPAIVYVQYRRGSIYLEDLSDVGAYAELFDHLRARALGPDESRDLIQHLLGEPS
ncbi:MAG: helix-turn-helix domain-containing protein [Streptosporangiaceae bacterium]